ncbi:MAG: choice-of-anchor D domain-containing protein, partial [Flammeovirgaceae bacterium]|nr:choice-of-anchor D domain-containing protein [Flammeovirgaceae bacterium]
VNNNDPLKPEVGVPVTLHVIGAPNITVDADSVNFGEVFLNYVKEDSILIRNTGTDDLLISLVNTVAPFDRLFTPFTLNPGESQHINVSFSPTSVGSSNGLLTIESNDPGEPSITIVLTGKGVNAPVIGVSPTSLSASLLTGQQQTKTLTINNTGGSALHWNLSIDNAGSNSLADILESLNNRYSEITSVIPNRYDFYEGESGYTISDGGGDMYDGGNYLGTNLGGYINYTQGVISSTSQLGSGNSYFTMKYPGLFVMAADMDVSYFEITGDLGADGSGNVDADVLQMSFNGKNYKGFVKRVYNAWDPSVNHLIIVEEASGAGHDYSTNTNSDYHRLTSLSGSTRVYYLLFAGNSGHYIDNTSMQNIMSAFLTASNVGIGWLSANKESGTIDASQSEIVDVTFDASGLDGGVYTTTISINSDDPATPVKNVPVTLTVTGAPDIAITKSSVNFQNVYVGGSKELFFNIKNTGSDILNVSSITVNNTSFTVSPSTTQLNPHDSTRVYIQFNPTEVGAKSGLVRIVSNDADENELTVSISGTGITAPAVTITPDNISVVIVSGDRKYIKVRLRNTGGDQLNWSVDNSGSPWWSSIDVTSGYLFPGNERDLTLTMDARNVTASTYTWLMRIYTNDPLRQQVSIPFTVKINQNHAPVVVQALPDLQMQKSSQVEINLADYFSDSDLEALKFYADCDSVSIASTSVSGSVLTVSSHEFGTTDVTVVAEDGLGEIATQTFNIVVELLTATEDLMTISKLRNFPNPFEGKTTLQFSLQKTSTVNLKIYDGSGREHFILQNRILEGGEHTVDTGEILPSGIYLVKLHVDGLPAGTIKVMKK